MAKALTGTFTITSRLSTGAQGYDTATIPIGSLIDVGDAQALEIESVDYIYQAYHTTNAVYEVIHPGMPFGGDVSFGAQLMDRNAQTMIPANDNNLISSSAVAYDYANVLTAASDFFPDDFQKTNGRFVVNDEIYLTSFLSGVTQANTELSVTVRIRAKVVKLSTRDWMAISLETVQNE
tara:strand:+ start:852 stop:1388 length:537 start_codon:yes stop_codon:yes gene_type:complete